MEGKKTAFWVDFHSSFVGVPPLLCKAIICYLVLDVHFPHLTSPLIHKMILNSVILVVNVCFFLTVQFVQGQTLYTNSQSPR